MTSSTPATPAKNASSAPSVASQSGAHLDVIGTVEPAFELILTPEALRFVSELHRLFSGTRHDRLADRMRKRYEIGNGRDPKFRDDTAHIREDSSWQVAPFAPGLEDRRVEITGPVDHDSAVAALNSGANVWLADMEDATSPTWHNIIDGQITLYKAIRQNLSGVDAQAQHPTIVMRPRGWHLVEKHIRFVDANGQSAPASGSLVDFGL